MVVEDLTVLPLEVFAEPEPQEIRKLPLKTVKVQTDMTMNSIQELELGAQQCAEMRSQLQKGYNFFAEEKYKDDNKKIHYITGLPNYQALMTVFTFVGKSVKQGRSLKPLEELLVTLAKLRLDLGFKLLGFLTSTSETTACRIFDKWLMALDIRLTPTCIIWPERPELQMTMPNCFKETFGQKVVSIIDCFELQIKRPSSLLARAQTWSDYKKRNTVKYLISITPQGTVSFVSKGWGGRVSDKHLTEHCDYLRNILPGDVVLADRGFTVTEEVAMVGGKILMPAFTKGKNQLSALELEESRSLSSVRIHVERVIGHVKNKYTILRGPLHIHLLNLKYSEEIPMIDRIVRVCCALANICDPIVPFN